MKETNIQFVKEVEKYEELYNLNYSKEDIVKRSWTNIGKKFNMSGKESKEKWNNLRNLFLKNLRVIPNEQPVKRRRPHYLIHAMHFLIPFENLLSVEDIRSVNIPCTPIIDVEDIPSAYTSHEINIALQNSMLPSTSSPSTSGLHHILGEFLPYTSVDSSSIASENCPELPEAQEMNRDAWPSDNSDKISVDFRAKKIVQAKQNINGNLILHAEGLQFFFISLMPDLAMLTPTQIRTFKRKTSDIIEQLLDGH